jgi:hypothetical protein
MNKAQIKDILGVDHKWCDCCREWLTLDKYGIFGQYSDGSTRYNKYCIQCDIYRSVNVPVPMLKEIQRIIKSKKSLGFESTDEFVREALRRSIAIYGK